MRKNWLKIIVSSLIAFAIIGATLNLAACNADEVATTQGTLDATHDELAAAGESTEHVDLAKKAVNASVKADGTIDARSAIIGGGPVLALWALREGLKLRKKEQESALVKKETSGSGTFGQRPT